MQINFNINCNTQGKGVPANTGTPFSVSRFPGIASCFPAGVRLKQCAAPRVLLSPQIPHPFAFRRLIVSSGKTILWVICFMVRTMALPFPFCFLPKEESLFRFSSVNICRPTKAGSISGGRFARRSPGGTVYSPPHRAGKRCRIIFLHNDLPTLPKPCSPQYISSFQDGPDKAAFLQGPSAYFSHDRAS